MGRTGILGSHSAPLCLSTLYKRSYQLKDILQLSDKGTLLPQLLASSNP
jgi:hypothetical protein